MLKPTVELLDKEYVNLLDVIVRTGGHTLPTGATSWGLVAVRRDASTAERTFVNGQPCPAVGGVDAAEPAHDDELTCSCESAAGIAVATTEDYDAAPLWAGVSFAGLPANRPMLVGYHEDDILDNDRDDCDGAIVRVRRLHVVADIDVADLLQAYGTGADLRGLQLSGGSAATGLVLMFGVTSAHVDEIVGRGIDLDDYACALLAGKSHPDVVAMADGVMGYFGTYPGATQAEVALARAFPHRFLRALREGLSPQLAVGYLAVIADTVLDHVDARIMIDQYRRARRVATQQEVEEAYWLTPSLATYTDCRNQGLTHRQAIAQSASLTH
ncbi:hypothetical protein [Nonomuraea sp. NPDC049784]|uniref:hypothetical protein n=1 Tax=Nonomuraea sp. NPDC049784 TaxID=3154361 RepID=UPI0033D8284F